MANNKKLIHLKSAVKDKRPTAEQLEYGSLAINYNAENPFISIKDSNDEVVTFPSEKTIDNVVSGAVETILPEVMGDNYYDKTESDERFALKGDVPTDVYTKEETNAAISAATDGLASEQWVQDQHYLTQHQSLDNYYTKAETSGSTQIATALAGKANTGDIPVVPTNVSAFTNDAGYLTQHQSLANYYTKGEVDEELAGKSDTGHTHTVSDITDFPVIPEVPTKTSDLVNDSGFATSGYVDTQIGVLSGATDVKLEQKANVSDIPSLDGYATQEWVNEQGYLTEHQSLDDYYTKEQTSGSTQIAEALAGKADVGDIPTDVYTKEEVDDAISAATEDMATQTWVGEQGFLTQHQSLENYYTKDETSGSTQISAALTLKANVADIPDVSGYFDDAQYDDNTHRINFYHGNEIEAYIDASPFIIDGMVDDVRIETLSGTTYLVIDFNTASGKEDILIPLTDIFNPANYYTKSEVDSAISGATDDMATQTWVTSQGYLTQHQDISGLATKQEVETLSGATDTKLAGKQDTLIAGENITISGNTISATGGGSSYTAGTNMKITSSGTINCTIPVNTGSYNDYRSDLSFGTEINLGSDYYRIGIGRNINFGKGSYTKNAIAICTGSYSSSEKTNIYGTSSIAIGNRTEIGISDNLSGVANSAVAIGNNARAKKGTSVALGAYSETNAEKSVAIGYYNLANAEYGFNCGKYNIGQTDTLFELGNGTSTSARSNAVEVKNNGDVYIMLDGQMVKLQDHLGGGGSVTIDPALDPTSSNAVANSAITEAISAKFDASGITEYYTSTEVDNAISGATQDMATKTWVGEQGYLTEHQSLADYYTKSETSGSTQISSALADKSDTGHTHTVSDITNMPTLPTKTSDLTNDSGYITSGTVETMIDGYATESWVQSQGYLTEHQSLSAYSTTEEVTLAITEATSGKADSDEVYLKSETSGATEISTALAAKQDTLIAGENITISGNTISATGGGGGGGMTEDDELLLATAITDLNDNKLSLNEAKLYFQIKGNYQPKGDYVTTSVLNTRLADYETALDEQNIEEVAAYALNDLNNRFDGLRLKKMTQEAYNALSGATDSNTLYIITA